VLFGKSIKRPVDLAIINRGFWPSYPVLGEGLFRLAEKYATDYDKEVVIISQNRKDISQINERIKRSKKIKIFASWAFSSSYSSISVRILDSVFFMLWCMFFLVRTRPRKIYISTDPPLLIPFTVMIFCKFFKTKYVYHIQDIHPEATAIVTKMNAILISFIRNLDNISLKNAETVITISSEMKRQIYLRTKNKLKRIKIIRNPSVSEKIKSSVKKVPGFCFCGNAGRYQRISLLVDSIRTYHKEGGKLPFVFVGGGKYTNKLTELDNEDNLFNYYGQVDSKTAQEFSYKFEWALLPIDDDVTLYAFPSKASTYVCSNSKILSICGEETVVAKWVKRNKLGLSINPDLKEVVNIFHKIESNQFSNLNFDMDRKTLRAILSYDFFLKSLIRTINR